MNFFDYLKLDCAPQFVISNLKIEKEFLNNIVVIFKK